MNITAWGRYPRIQANVFQFEKTDQLKAHLTETSGCSIAYGKGRSYGDSALNRQVIFSNRFNKILDFDPSTGILTCESGLTLEEIIQVFLPKGWFMSVTPGTKFITVGGAIASDVHGKNHHIAGAFSENVLALELMLSDGDIVRCSRNENPKIFRATCGGMGLTGVILSAVIALQPVKSSFIQETIIACDNLEEAFIKFEENRSASYSVAWIDCMAKGRNIGRSILFLGEHTDAGGLSSASPARLSIPIECPSFCLNRYSISLFNQIYFRKNARCPDERFVSFDHFFYPLDSISHWNRMYGSKGFTQYQCVLPKSESFKGLRKILNNIATSGMGSFLAILKLLGPENENLISFPMEGYTLALDFKIEKALFPFLDELDRLVLDHGGRLYLAKDVRMKKSVFRNGYPHWKPFLQLRENMGMNLKFNSLQSERLEI